MPGAVVASLGELLVEFISTETGGHNLHPLPYVGPFASGAPGIFIDQAARLGARAVFAGAVGADAFGTVLRQRLTGAGVSEALIRTVPGLPTGTAHVSYNDDGSRDFVFNIAHSAAALFPDGAGAVAAFRAAGAEVIHVSGSTLGDPGMRGRVMAIVRTLKDAGVTLSFDPNIRTELMTDAGYMTAARDLLALADYVLPSDADAALLFPGVGFEEWSAGFLARGARVVALKRGAGGAIARDAVGQHARPGHPVAVVDPTGAGDCFCATLVTCLLQGADLPAALSRANAAGALAVGKLGPMEGNSTRAQIEAFLAARA
jgi:sugar/nucleoside kinase (ribokinase family)